MLCIEGGTMFEAVKSNKVFDQVIVQIKDLIRAGKLKCGDKLPSERDMSEQLHASRPSVREALRALETLGIIEARQGGGNYIKEQFEDSLLESLSITFLLHGSQIEEILTLRLLIEPQIAAMAAEKRSKEQVMALKELLLTLAETEDEIMSAALDKQLHYLIVQASGNKPVSYMMYAVSSLVEEYITNVRSNMFIDSENKIKIQRQHEAIIAAIEKQDDEGSSSAMREHLKYTNDYLTDKVPYNK